MFPRWKHDKIRPLRITVGGHAILGISVEVQWDMSLRNARIYYIISRVVNIFVLFTFMAVNIANTLSIIMRWTARLDAFVFSRAYKFQWSARGREHEVCKLTEFVPCDKHYPGSHAQEWSTNLHLDAIRQEDNVMQCRGMKFTDSFCSVCRVAT